MKKTTFFLKKIVLPTFLALFFLTLIASSGTFFYLKYNNDFVKNFITDEMTQRIGYDVEIASIESKWSLTNPSIITNSFEIFNKDRDKSISVDRIELVFSWLSLIRLEPIFDRIELTKPEIEIVRETNGALTFNGIIFNDNNEKEDLSFLNWLLNQDDLIIRNGGLRWQDRIRGEDTLEISELSIDYSSSRLLSFFGRHNFNISGLINQASPEKIIINGYIDFEKLKNISSIDGRLSFIFDQFKLASLKPWLDYPIDLVSGDGNLDITINVEKGEINSLAGQVNLANVAAITASKEIKIIYVQGSINAEKKNNKSLIQVSDFNVNVDNGPNLENVKLEIGITDNKDLESVFLNLKEIDLDVAAKISPYLPSELIDIKNNIEALAPKGNIKNLKLNWKKGDRFFTGLDLDMQLYNLNIQSLENFPAIENLTATFNIKNGSGSIVSNSKNLIFTKKDLFREPLKFSEVNGQFNWKEDVFNLKDINVMNSDFVAKINANYKLSENNEDSINLEIDIPRANIADLKEYYPIQIGKEGLNWLDTSLLKGEAKNTKITVKGNPKDFPYVNHKNEPDSKKGIFKITSEIINSTVEYGSGWPYAENFDINLTINGSRIEFLANKGHILNNTIKSFKGLIEDFTETQPMLLIETTTDSPLDIMLNAVNKSPIKQAMKGTSDDMRGKGPGELNLHLNIPMKNVDNITFNGIYTFTGSSLDNPSLDLPLLSNINGTLIFDTNTVSITNAEAILFDQPVAITLNNLNDITLIDIKGSVDTDFIKSKLGIDWGKNINGKTEWQAIYKLKDKESELSLTSDLIGISIENFQDFNKSPEQEKSFVLKKNTSAKGSNYLDISYGNFVTAKLIKDKKDKISQGFIGINAKLDMPKNGVKLVANFKKLNTEDYKFIFNRSNNKVVTESKGNNNTFDPLIDEANLNINELILEGNKLTNTFINYLPIASGSKTNITSNEVVGNITYNESNHLYNGNFKKIHLMGDKKVKNDKEKISIKNLTAPENKKIQVNDKVNQMLLVINSLKINDSDYGKLNLKAHENAEGIIFDNFKLEKESNTIEGSGYWHSEIAPQKTSINFKWGIKNIGNTLGGLGYPDLVDKGEATINGSITWDDSPNNFDPDYFYGNFNLIAKKGTVQKINPSVSGRLVGLLSLQNLPRRLSLDFSDLFQEGLPFDRIESSVTLINKGVLSSKALKIDGPSAQILMNGQIDFVKETQDLDVTIRPKISDTITAGALIGGPLAAAAAFIAQKVLDDPLNKITTAEYHITGTWDEPQETKVESKGGNFIEETIINPTGDVLNASGGVIDGLIIKPTQDVIDFIFKPKNEPENKN